MPMYEYLCAVCGHEDTLLEKISAGKIKKCPSCGKVRQFKRQLSAPSFQLKGTGWYATDFRNNGQKPDTAAAEGGSKSDAKLPKDSKDSKDSKATKPAATSSTEGGKAKKSDS